MIGHQLVGQQFDLVSIEAFSENSFERLVVTFLVKDDRASIAAIQRMVRPPASSARLGLGIAAVHQNAWGQSTSPDPFSASDPSSA